MVFVKVRETYDLHTLPNKLTVIGVHTPKAEIIKRNYAGLLMQCKMYRPVSCDIKMACASMLPLDPLGVGTSEGDVAPEDIFNPILYKAVSNKSMSQIEQYINQANGDAWVSRGDSLDATNNGLVSDDFAVYYGLLANTHEWKHANPQSGLSMRNVKPLVYEILTNLGDNREGPQVIVNNLTPGGIGPTGKIVQLTPTYFKGSAKSMPFLNCTVPIGNIGSDVGTERIGFTPVPGDQGVSNGNSQLGVPCPRVMCACLIVPPSRRHQLFYRLVVEWTLEFTSIRSLGEIASYNGLQSIGNAQHVMDYDFGESKILSETTNLVDTSEDSGITKVM